MRAYASRLDIIELKIKSANMYIAVINNNTNSSPNI